MRVPNVKPPSTHKPSADQASAAQRMLLELRELERQATEADLRMLAYLIDCAIIEAERAVKATDAA